MASTAFSAQAMLSRCFLLFATALSSSPRDCRHGVYVPETKSCRCDKHWGTAGITDTVDFLEGVCEQYHCIDDSTCQKELGIPGASCPVPSWNCYCGWEYALSNGWRGYEIPRSENGTDTGAECMGIMYTISVWGALTVGRTMEWVFKGTLLLALLCSLVGKRRIRCDHHDPSLLKEIRRCLGRESDCPGGCSSETEYSWDSFQDDLAWSIYVISVSVWMYVFLLIAYLMALFVWSIILWAAVLLLLVLAAMAGLCMLCGEGAAGCACDGCELGGCAGCCCDLTAGGPAAHTFSEAMYWAGPHPVDGWFCDCSLSTAGSDPCSSCCSSRGFCFPIAWLILRFPRMPENMWGGCLGRCMRTHSCTAPEVAYQGGNPLIDFLSMQWMRSGDLHEDTGWRNQVHDFLYSSPREELPYEDIGEVNGGEKQFQIGRVSGRHKGQCFTDQDRCVPSSFEDYKENHCWICQSANEEWDLWETCRHMFCKRCSEEMLRRRMPCPLCRPNSGRILRGFAEF